MTLKTKKPDVSGNISTPMPLAGHDAKDLIHKSAWHISTPMPLAGHDQLVNIYFTIVQYFYSHAPRGA